MTTYEAFFKYVDTKLVPGLYAGSWYNGKKLTWREALTISDGNYHTIRVGVPRFRQFRVKPSEFPNKNERYKCHKGSLL